MKKLLQSHNSAVGTAGKNFFFPSLPQGLLYILISILLLLALSGKRIWDYLNNVILARQGGLDSVIDTKWHGLHKFLNSVSQSIILQVLFWVCVGCITYIFIWFVKNVVINIINDVAADKYMHPRSYNRFGYWKSVIAQKIFFGISLAVLIFYILAVSKMIYAFASLSYTLVSDFGLSHNIIKLGGYVLLTSLSMHILILLAHTTANAWRFIYRGL